MHKVFNMRRFPDTLNHNRLSLTVRCKIFRSGRNFEASTLEIESQISGETSLGTRPE